MMCRFLFLLFLLPHLLFADTIDHYMNIASNIPKMEMKADQQAQAWARSARHILILTSESIIESLLMANKAIGEHGALLFCPTQNAKLDGESMNELIQKTYQENKDPLKDKNKMTVSQIALMGLQKQFPCSEKTKNDLKNMHHVSSPGKYGLSAFEIGNKKPEKNKS